MLMIQIEVSHLFERKVVWVDASWNLKVGQQVRFQGVDARKWDVQKVYETKIDIAEIKTKWGLELPKSQRTER